MSVVGTELMLIVENGICAWCGRRESNPHEDTINGFSYQLRLSPSRVAPSRFGEFVVWTIASL